MWIFIYGFQDDIWIWNRQSYIGCNVLASDFELRLDIWMTLSHVRLDIWMALYHVQSKLYTFCVFNGSVNILCNAGSFLMLISFFLKIIALLLRLSYIVEWTIYKIIFTSQLQVSLGLSHHSLSWYIGSEASTAQTISLCSLFYMDGWETSTCWGSLSNSRKVSIFSNSRCMRNLRSYTILCKETCCIFEWAIWWTVPINLLPYCISLLTYMYHIRFE